MEYSPGSRRRNVAGKLGEIFDHPTLRRLPFPAIHGHRIEGILGRGGMGVVYLAQDLTLERQVAIKLLTDDSPEMEARFLREARFMANVRHPHVAPVYTYGRCHDGAYLVMEYYEGGSLSDRIRTRGCVPVAEAVDIVAKIAEGLEAAWNRGVVHRDVKPSNILLDGAGGIFVADFGLAKRMDAKRDERLTGVAFLVGTPHYVAPELVRGDEADLRSDMYSLGILFFELLTSELPFEAPTQAAVAALQIHGTLPDLRQKCPNASRELTAIVNAMTAKDPIARPQSYRELLRALRCSATSAEAERPSEPRSHRFFMDRHVLQGATPGDVAQAHLKDQVIQDDFGVKALTYWFDCERGTAFCLFEAPDKDSVAAVHRRAHGLLPSEVIEVQPEAVKSFLGRMADPSELTEELPSESGLRALMVAIVSNSAKLTNELGDEGALEVLNGYHACQQRILAEHGGRQVRRLPDGLLASFLSPSRAVECAIAMLRATVREHPAIHSKIGLDAGEPVAKNDGLFGATVHLADAIATHCDADRILVSRVVCDLCRGKKLALGDRKEVCLPGFDEPVTLFEVDWHQARSGSQVVAAETFAAGMVS